MAIAPHDPRLSEVKDELRAQLIRGEVATCPACERIAKIYRNKIDSAMARTLILMYRTAGEGQYIHVPSMAGDNHKVSQLSWWGLVEDSGDKRDDGGRAGWWRVSDRGANFARGLITVEKYAYIYDSKVMRFSDGLPCDIHDCLGDKFNYTELMSS